MPTMNFFNFYGLLPGIPVFSRPRIFFNIALRFWQTAKADFFKKFLIRRFANRSYSLWQ